jgi:protein-L-isoaspartate O-methyltransferase
MAAAGGREKPPEEWEAQAEKMGKMQGESPNVREFVACMDLTGCATLLHIGWGRGAIALALAPEFKRVYPLDYSQGMLNVLMRNAQTLGYGRIEPIRVAWEDNWHAAPACDRVTASCSTMVMDMAAALRKGMRRPDTTPISPVWWAAASWTPKWGH